MTLEAGARSQLVTLQRFSATADDYGGEVQTWADLKQERAQIRFGTGQERRSAAQEGSSQAATFGILGNPITRSLTTKDRIFFMGVPWDIEGLNPTSDNKGIVVTAVRAD